MKNISRCKHSNLFLPGIIDIVKEFYNIENRFERYGSDNKRTLLNMLFSKFCWLGITFMFTVQVLKL